jgi:hypothetical protein
LEQFDQVAGGVGDQDLATAGAGDQVAAERQPGRTQSVDLGVQIVDDQVDTVAAGRGGIVGVARAAELAWPDSNSRSGPRTTSAKAGAALLCRVNPRWVV